MKTLFRITLVLFSLIAVGCTRRVDLVTLRQSCIEHHVSCTVANYRDFWAATASRPNGFGSIEQWEEYGDTQPEAMEKLLRALSKPSRYPGRKNVIPVTP